MEKYIDLLNAMFFVESFADKTPFNPNANKGKKGVGRSIAGVTDTSWNEMKRKGMIPKSSRRYDPHDETRAGVKYFNWLIERPYIKGDERKAVAAYHAGPGTINKLVKKHGDNWEGFLPEDTQTHITNTYGALNKTDDFKRKYELESIPTYQPILDVMYEDNKPQEMGAGGNVKKHKIVYKAENGLSVPKIQGLQNGIQFDKALPVISLPILQSPDQPATKENSNFLGKLGTPLSIAGGITETANMASDDPSIGLGAFSGAAKGAGALSMLGPLGMLGGAVIGGATGAFSAVQKKAAVAEQDYLEQQNIMRNKSMDPSKGIRPLGKGGIIMEGTEVQTEKGENITLPDFTLIKSGAKKTHKQMEDGEVTDLLPDGSYVNSNQIKLKKEDADEIILGVEPVIYEEGKAPKLPSTETMGDYFNKKENTPAEIAKAIADKFKITERRDNIFSIRTQEENRISRAMRLPVVSMMNEAAKGSTEQQVDEYGHGGWINRLPTIYPRGIKGNSPILNPEDIPAIDNPYGNEVSIPGAAFRSSTPEDSPQFDSAVYDAASPQATFTEESAGEQKQQPYIQQLQDINEEQYQTLKSNSNRLNKRLKSLAGADFLQRTTLNLMQNPNETPYQEEASFLSERFRPTPRSLYESQISAINAPMNTNARILGEAGASPRDLAALMTTQNSQRLSTINQAAAGRIQEETALERAKYSELNRVGNENRARLVASENKRRENLNKMTVGASGVTSGYLQNLGNIASNKFSRDASLQSKYLNNALNVERTNRNLGALPTIGGSNQPGASGGTGQTQPINFNTDIFKVDVGDYKSRSSTPAMAPYSMDGEMSFDPTPLNTDPIIKLPQPLKPLMNPDIFETSKWLK